MKPQPTPTIVKVPTELVTIMHPDEIFGCIGQQFAQDHKSWCHIGMCAKKIGCSEKSFMEWSYVGKYANIKHQIQSQNFWEWIPSDHNI